MCQETVEGYLISIHFYIFMLFSMYIVFQCELHNNLSRHSILHQSYRALHQKESDSRFKRNMLATKPHQTKKPLARRKSMCSRWRHVSSNILDIHPSPEKCLDLTLEPNYKAHH